MNKIKNKDLQDMYSVANIKLRKVYSNVGDKKNSKKYFFQKTNDFLSPNKLKRTPISTYLQVHLSAHVQFFEVQDLLVKPA